MQLTWLFGMQWPLSFLIAGALVIERTDAMDRVETHPNRPLDMILKEWLMSRHYDVQPASPRNSFPELASARVSGPGDFTVLDNGGPRPTPLWAAVGRVYGRPPTSRERKRVLGHMRTAARKMDRAVLQRTFRAEDRSADRETSSLPRRSARSIALDPKTWYPLHKSAQSERRPKSSAKDSFAADRSAQINAESARRPVVVVHGDQLEVKHAVSATTLRARASLNAWLAKWRRDVTPLPSGAPSHWGSDGCVDGHVMFGIEAC